MKEIVYPGLLFVISYSIWASLILTFASKLSIHLDELPTESVYFVVRYECTYR